MQPYAIELGDRLLSVARAGGVLGSAPGIPLDTGMLGRWQEELVRRVAGDPPAPGERIWMASPARADARMLSAVIDAARAVGVAVDGFVDAAAVTVAALAPQRSALVLELGLHYVAVSVVERGAQARRRRAISSERGGATELNEAWLNLISTAMVKRARFDPLRHHDTEKQLRESLPQLIAQLATVASVTASATSGAERFDVELSRDQFVAAAQPVYREILRLLHELRPAGAAMTLVMPASVAALPALRDMLESFVGCELVKTADGFAAAATSLLDLPQADSDQSVRLLRRLPVEEQAALASLVSHELLGAERAAGASASHVLYEGRAHALEGALGIGRDPGTARSIVLPEGLAGVSRRHCTLLSEGGELLLLDHSRFGTYLNGERISERARARAGDRIRIGEPGVELALISLS